MKGAGPAVPARAHLVPARGCGCGSAPARGERPRPRVTYGPIRVPAGGAAQAAPGAGPGSSLSAAQLRGTPSPKEPGFISGCGSGGAALPSAGTRGGPAIAGESSFRTGVPGTGALQSPQRERQRHGGKAKLCHIQNPRKYKYFGKNSSPNQRGRLKPPSPPCTSEGSRN